MFIVPVMHRTIRIVSKPRLNPSTLISFLPTRFLVPLQVASASIRSTRQGLLTHLQVALVQFFLPFIVSYISSKLAHTGNLRLPTLELPTTDGVELLELEPSGFPVVVAPSPPPSSRSIGAAEPLSTSILNKAAASSWVSSSSSGARPATIKSSLPMSG